jgi:hypothetical protein
MAPAACQLNSFVSTTRPSARCIRQPNSRARSVRLAGADRGPTTMSVGYTQRSIPSGMRWQDRSTFPWKNLARKPMSGFFRPCDQRRRQAHPGGYCHRMAALARLRQNAAREEGGAERRDREVRASQQNVGAKAARTYGHLGTVGLGTVGFGGSHGLTDLLCLRAIVSTNDYVCGVGVGGNALSAPGRGPEHQVPCRVGSSRRKRHARHLCPFGAVRRDAGSAG